MSKYCKWFGGNVLYLDCLECETKYCKHNDKLCWTCIHRIKQASNFRCEFTGNNLNTYYFMRSDCSKYEKEGSYDRNSSSKECNRKEKGLDRGANKISDTNK